MTINEWTPERLAPFRQVADLEADRLVEKLQTDFGPEAITALFRMIVRNGEADNPAIAKILRDFFVANSALPSWADPARLNLAAKLFEKYIPEVFSLLLLSALPLSYCCGNGAHVLVITGRLASRSKSPKVLSRRLMETAQFVMDCMTTGAFAEDGKAFASATKVRIIHAAIRSLIKTEKARGWDSDLLGPEYDSEIEGLPINQEDLAGTLLAFSVAIPAGLKVLDIALSDEQTESWVHSWNVIGHALGIRDELLPAGYDEGYALARSILRHQAAASEHGAALTEALTGFIDYLLPGNRFERLCQFLMVFFLSDLGRDLGRPLHECIGLKPVEDTSEFRLRFLKRNFDAVQFGKNHLLLTRMLLPKLHPLLMQGIILHYNEDKAAAFSMPEHLGI